MPQTALRDQLTAVMRDIDNGAGVATSFARHPRAFDAVFVAILAAGETGGDLTATFGRLAQHLRLARQSPRTAAPRLALSAVPAVRRVGRDRLHDDDGRAAGCRPPAFARQRFAALDALAHRRFGMFSAAAWWVLPLIAGGGWLATRLLRRHSESAALAVARPRLRPVVAPVGGGAFRLQLRRPAAKPYADARGATHRRRRAQQPRSARSGPCGEAKAGRPDFRFPTVTANLFLRPS